MFLLFCPYDRLILLNNIVCGAFVAYSVRLFVVIFCLKIKSTVGESLLNIPLSYPCSLFRTDVLSSEFTD
jgi:hypothetical protein